MAAPPRPDARWPPARASAPPPAARAHRAPSLRAGGPAGARASLARPAAARRAHAAAAPPARRATQAQVSTPGAAQAAAPHRVPGAPGFPEGVYVHPTSASTVLTDDLAPGVVIGPFCVVDADVALRQNVVLDGHNAVLGTTHIGEGTRLLHGAVVGAADGGGGTTLLGAHNTVGHHAAVGVVCQDLKYDQSTTASHLVVGDHNDIREGASIHRSSYADTATVLGDGNLVMNHAHVGHDASVGDGNVLASGSLLAGHVRIGNRCVVGGGVAIAQRCVVGDYAFLAGGTMVDKDVPPCVKAMGDRAVTRGINDIQLVRCGVSDEERSLLRVAYRKLWFGRDASSSAGETARRLLAAPGSDASYPPDSLARHLLAFVAEADDAALAASSPRVRVGAVCSGRRRRPGSDASAD